MGNSDESGAFVGVAAGGLLVVCRSATTIIRSVKPSDAGLSSRSLDPSTSLMKAMSSRQSDGELEDAALLCKQLEITKEPLSTSLWRGTSGGLVSWVHRDCSSSTSSIAPRDSEFTRSPIVFFD